MEELVAKMTMLAYWQVTVQQRLHYTQQA